MLSINITRGERRLSPIETYHNMKKGSSKVTIKNNEVSSSCYGIDYGPCYDISLDVKAGINIL